MQCPQCQYENLPDSVFCPECGTKLARLCSRCGAENHLTSKFCRKCGTPLTKGEKGKREKGEKENRQSDPRTSDPALWTPPHLAERIRAEQAAMEARGATDGERKTITALFADIKGSMDLIEDLDPEEARHIVDPALQFMMNADLRRVGTVHLNVRAQGAHPIPADLHIPPTVHAVLASRIDRLPPEAKELLQILSVIGKEFSLSLLKQVRKSVFSRPSTLPAGRARSRWNCER